MATVMIFHEVDDVAHWVASPKREEAFATVGATVRTFVDPEGSNRVGIIAEIPDMDAFQAMLTSDTAAEAMKHDGVRPETIVLLVAS
jgi:antibiotic biosynthesis monooxygenase (ABM) superfamily enzyme